jgi:hypothetical protein
MTERDLLALLGVVYEADVAVTHRDTRRARARLSLAMRMLLDALDDVRRRRS